MARTALNTGGSSIAGTSYMTGSFAVGAGQVALAFVASISPVGTTAVPPTAAGNGLTWDMIATIQPPGVGVTRLTCFRTLGGPSSAVGALTFNFLQSQLACAWSIFQYDQIDISGVNGSGAVIQVQSGSARGTSIGVALGPLADPSTSTLVGGILLGPPEIINPGASFVAIDQQTLMSSIGQTQIQTEDRLGGSSTVDWTWSATSAAAAIVLEVKAEGITVSGPPQDAAGLAKAFEPVLVLMQDERFVPSNAKAYIEQCALWKAETPFDDKNSWGGKGAPFDRLPIIDHGHISVLAGESGTLLGPANLADTQIEERFIELTGWKDPSGNPEPKVTATSKNRYSEREFIAQLYNNTPMEGGNDHLRDSRFWYHAELLANPLLRALLGSVTAPNLANVLTTFKNAALLNYYLFFPAHEQSADPTCTNIEALEFNCFAGEWGCISILLEQDQPGSDFVPSLIGCTGCFISDNPNIAQAPDDGDAAKRIWMKVFPFTAATLVGQSPQLFVAKGTHSLYLQPGPVAVDFPDDSRPFLCATGEGTPVDQPDNSTNPFAPLGILLAKMMAGNGLLGPIGALAGLVAGIVEWTEGNFGLGVTGERGPVPNDVTADVSTGLIIRSPGLNVPGAGPDQQQDWLAAQGVMQFGRRYDFVVDRASQRWWPGQFGQGGYTGHWGPRVTIDPFGRRAGMKFPAFWHMFFLAVANGKTLHVL